MPSSKTKFIFSTVGTLGDLLPLFALAKELMERGFACHVLGNECGASRAAALGIEFSVIAPTMRDILTTKQDIFGNYMFPSYAPTVRFFERELKAGHELVVVNRNCYSATTMLAELCGLPLCRLYLAPFQVRSLEAPARPWKVKADGPLGDAFKKHELPRILDAWERDAYILEKLNVWRSAFGLSAIGNVLELEPVFDYNLAFFPDWYAPPASDWVAPMDLVGFPLGGAEVPLPRSLERLIQSRGRPLVFTPGTGIARVEKFFAAARECCERLGRPGVLLSPHASEGYLGSDMLQFPFLELGSLLSRAALLVHHGGVGTTARALEAGIPQVVSPWMGDQPDNGGRVADLGVGCVLEPAALSGETLAAAAAVLLDDPAVAERGSQLRQRIAQTAAVERGADLLVERLVQSQPNRSKRIGCLVAARA
jgi:rhamnosyltransferase subunit B